MILKARQVLLEHPLLFFINKYSALTYPEPQQFCPEIHVQYIQVRPQSSRYSAIG